MHKANKKQFPTIKIVFPVKMHGTCFSTGVKGLLETEMKTLKLKPNRNK